MSEAKKLHILFIEDSEDDTLLMEAELHSAGLNFVSHRVENEAELRAALQGSHWDIIISDFTMPAFNALHALSTIRNLGFDTPCIVVSGTIGEETAVATMKAGAVDYFMKGRLQKFPSAVERHILEHKVRQEKKRAYKRMREIEKRFQIMADTAPVKIWMADASGRVIYFNKGWYNFTGRKAIDDLGCGWAELIHPQDRDNVTKTYFEAFHARRDFTIEYRLRRYDGVYRWLLDQGTPRYEEDERFTGYIGSCIDITERKIAEAEREAALHREKLARQEAERLNRIKDEFLATLSHELRTPMHAITGWAELLDRQLLDEEEAREAYTAIYQSALAQNQLISDLLDISGMISGKIQLEAKPTNLINIIQSSLETVHLSAEAKNIEISFEFDKNIGPIRGDRTRLKQIIWNLLSNAIKFTPKNGQIHVSAEQKNSTIEIRVKDSGEGIDPEFLPLVFDRFSQSDSSLTRRHGGLGIGLSIVRHLVELHGGQVEAHSDGRNQGSTFIVRLPILGVQIPSSLPPYEEEAASPEVLTPRSKKLDQVKILIVDDHPDVIFLVKTILQRQGAQVFTACSVEEAMMVYQAQQPDLLLSDIGMPMEDGYDLIKKIRALQPNGKSKVAAVALSAHIQEDIRQKALRAGYFAHLTKPVDASSLVNTLVELKNQLH